MNILVVHSLDINDFPPVRNLVEVLAENGNKVTLLTRNRNGNLLLDYSRNIRIIKLPEKAHGLLRIFNYIARIKFMRATVDREMKSNDILWTTTDLSIRELKGHVLKYKHIMQLMELVEDTPEIFPFDFMKVGLKKYAQKAYKVVVPEYNRACIQKAWWELKQTPTILPNKPKDDVLEEKNAPPEALKIIEEVKKEKRRIILYQGWFGIDRNFEMFAEALAPLKDKYCFYLMGKDNDYLQKLCSQYPEIKYIGFLPPPYHLLITPYAYAALLTYVPAKSLHYSVLNPLYCAPNKIYEYAKYGVPMIGNDVPGLVLPFDKYGIGKIYQGGGAEEMRTILEGIETDYQRMSENCRKFYDDTDLYRIVEDIIS